MSRQMKGWAVLGQEGFSLNVSLGSRLDAIRKEEGLMLRPTEAIDLFRKKGKTLVPVNITETSSATELEQKLKVAVSCLMADVKHYFDKKPGDGRINWPQWFDLSMTRAADALKAYEDKRNST